MAAAQNGGVSYTNGYTNGDAFDDMRSEERYIQVCTRINIMLRLCYNRVIPRSNQALEKLWSL